jgi:hypothetical protein
MLIHHNHGKGGKDVRQVNDVTHALLAFVILQ